MARYSTIDNNESTLKVMRINKKKKTAGHTGMPHQKQLPKANLRYAGLIICLLPALALIYLILHSGINVCILDQFNAIVPLFDKLHSGNLTFADLWERHNEHIILFPALIMLALGALTRFNTVAEMFFIMFLMVLLYRMYAAVIKNQFRITWKNFPLWFFPAALLNFSWVQSENILWGFQISFVLALTAAVTSIFFLYQAGKTAAENLRTISFVIAVASAIIASFSSSMGIMVWIAGIIPLALAEFSFRRKAVFLSIFSVIGTTVWIIFLSGYTKPEGHPSVTYFAEHPITFIQYLIVCIGGAIVPQSTFAFIAGIIIAITSLLTMLIVIRHKRIGANSFWIGIFSLSLLNILSIAAGRAGFGPEHALISRYTTFAIPGIIALYCILNDIRCTTGRKTYTGYTLMFGGIMLTGALAAYFLPLQTRSSAETAYDLYTYDKQPDIVLTHLFPNPEEARRDAAILKKLRYNVFADHALQNRYPENLSSLAQCTLNATLMFRWQPITVTIPSPTGDRTQQSAWFQGIACETDTRNCIGGVYIGVDSLVFPAFYGKAGLDTFFSIAGYPPEPGSGFECIIPGAIFTPGKHTIRFMLLSQDRTCYWMYPKTTEIEIK